MTELSLDQVVAKWTPLTIGLDPNKEARCAWALEQESIYLKSITDHERSKMGAKLKFTFPVIRRAIDVMDEDASNTHCVHEAVKTAVSDVTEAAFSFDPMDDLPEQDKTALLDSLSLRLYDSLIRMPA